MKVQVFQLFFKNDGVGGLMPVDAQLYELAVKYAQEHITEPSPLRFTDYKTTWIAAVVDAEGKPARVEGILCMQMLIDFPICRFTDNAAVVKLVQRANDHLHDNYGLRGGYALVRHVEDAPPESRCPHYLEWMKLYDLKPAHRYEIKIR